MKKITFDSNKFENIHQIAGIRTGTLDSHPLGGPGGRVAFVDTGAGLRFTIALDRGGDIVDARYNHVALAYLTPNGFMPPNHAHHTGIEWLHGWAGGLLTTCGPQYMGGPRTEDGIQTSLHGHYSNQAAAIEQLINPDPLKNQLGMQLSMCVRDSRMFGPVVEVRRTIRCTLGLPEIVIEDEVTNRANTRTAHNYLYHCNFGYPLVDRGSRFIYKGKAEYWIMPPPDGQDIVQPLAAARMASLKQICDPLAEHAGFGERGLIVEVPSDRNGLCHIGLINKSLKLGLQMSYPSTQFPRMANWQHYGPRGCYVAALEPFSGSLLGKSRDKDPRAQQYLQPGESRRYELKIQVLSDPTDLRALAACDGPLIPIKR